MVLADSRSVITPPPLPKSSLRFFIDAPSFRRLLTRPANAQNRSSFCTCSSLFQLPPVRKTGSAPPLLFLSLTSCEPLSPHSCLPVRFFVHFAKSLMQFQLHKRFSTVSLPLSRPSAIYFHSKDRLDSFLPIWIAIGLCHPLNI